MVLLAITRLVALSLTYADVHRIEFSCTEIVHDLVGREEAQRVREVLEVLHYAEDAREIAGIVARPWRGAIDTLAAQWRVDIQDHVNSCRVENGGASGVIELGVHVVDANSVDLDLQC